MMPDYRATHNGQAVPLQEVPCLPYALFSSYIIDSVDEGARICSFFGVPLTHLDEKGDGLRLFVVLAHDNEGTLAISSCNVEREFASLTPDCPQAHWFEREIYEQYFC